MYISGFNANNNYNPISINVLSVRMDQLRAISETEHTYNNITVRKSTDTSTSLLLNGGSTDDISSIGVLCAALSKAGAPIVGADDCYIVESELAEAAATVTVSQYHGTLSPYYYQFKHTTDEFNAFQMRFGNINQTNGTYGTYIRSFLAPIIAYDDEHFYYGILKIRVDNSAIKSLWSISFDPSINDYIDPDYDPGEKGFRPTAALTTRDRPGNGGRGTTNKKSPDYASDTVSQPGAPNESEASAVRSGFLNSYLMTQGELDKVCSALYSNTLIDFIKTLTVNPLDFIVSVMVFPTKPVLGSSENIKFGKWQAAATGVVGALGVQITGTRLANEFKTINFGTIQIPENWGNFLDYSQTAIELYLPFIGTVNIDVSECMGGDINVQYTIDFFTGMCVANVLCERSFPLPSGKFIPNRAQHAYQGNCAIQIPLSSANYGSMVGSLINACTQGITNPAGGFMGIASDAVGGGLRPNVSSKGNIVANSGFCSVLYPYVRITRPITAEPDSYQQVMGYPSYINTTLGECSDLCICDDIDLKGINGATDDELNRIRQMCKDGIYV